MPNCRGIRGWGGLNKVYQGENYQDFLRGLFLDHTIISKMWIKMVNQIRFGCIYCAFWILNFQKF